MRRFNRFLLIGQHPHCKLILSPIGAQGFVLGRGNLQLSPEVIEGIGGANLIVIATPAKLARSSTIPHGNSVLLLGESFEKAGPPPFGDGVPRLSIETTR